MTECQQWKAAVDHTKHEISLEFRELAGKGKARVSDDTSCMTCPIMSNLMHLLLG